MLKALTSILVFALNQTSVVVCVKFEAADWDESRDSIRSQETFQQAPEPFTIFPLCRMQNPFLITNSSSCPGLGSTSNGAPNRGIFDDEVDCWYLQNLYESKSWTYSSSSISTGVSTAAAAPARIAQSLDGTLDYVPMPCKQCDTDRKDRSFILGTSYTHAMAKLLVDYASSHAGGKILASSDHLKGVSDILVADDNRYLLSQCSNKVWFTIRLADEVFIEKIGLVASELFASTFRHIQILGSRQYPTSEWRVLGEIETNPLETQEWFDLSASSHCSKCYVKYLKVRVLTHHALEGYTNCALTRVQIFGSTLLQSLDKIQNMNNSSLSPSSSAGGNREPAFAKYPFEKLQVMMMVPEPVDTSSSQNNAQPNQGGTVIVPPPQPNVPNPPPIQEPPKPPAPTTSQSEESNNPLLAFVEEMTQLKKQYAALSHNLYAMNDLLKSQGGGAANETNPTSSSGTITISVLGTSFIVSRNWDGTRLVVILLVVVQCMTMYMVLTRRQHQHSSSQQTGQPITIDFRRYATGEESGSDSNETSRVRMVSKPFVTPMKKRHHGIWKPRIRRSVFYHYMGIPPKGDDRDVLTQPHDIADEKN